PVVKRFRVGGEKDAARVPRRLLDLLGRLRLLRVARGLRREAGQLGRILFPVSGVAHAIAGKIACVARRRPLRGSFGDCRPQATPGPVLGRLSMTRPALPCERCTVSGSTTRPLALTPI